MTSPAELPHREPPQVPVTWLPPMRPGDAWTVTVSCPHCKQQHVHGAGPDGLDLGHRVSHCDDRHKPNLGYVLVIPPIEAARIRRALKNAAGAR